MAYTLVKSGTREYAVDWDVVERLVSSYHRSVYQLEMSEAKTTSEATLLNPLSWSLPNVTTLDVPWEKVGEAAHNATLRTMTDYWHNAKRDMGSIANDVQTKVNLANVNKRTFTNWMQDIQFANRIAIDQAVGDYQFAIDGLKTIRDTSADIVGIGATMISGPIAVGLLASNSFIKGFGKYTDTGKVGPAVITGVGTLALGAFKVGGGTKIMGVKPSDGVLIVCQGVVDGATTWAEGKGFAAAVEKGRIKIASAGAAHILFKTELISTLFKSLPVPYNITVGGKEVANDVLGKYAKKLTEKGFAALENGPAAPPPAQPKPLPTPIDNAILHDQALLQMAIVNQRTGVGHAW